MTNEILIDAVHQEETRIAIIKDKRLEDYDYEFDAKKPIRGNIYLAKVIRVEPSLQAAFLDYGGNKNAFLPFSEINPDYYQIPQADKEEIKKSSGGNLEDDNQISSKEEESDEPDDVGGDELEEIESDRKKSKALNRELFRYQYDIKPRVICKRCRMGFRFGSQLVRHLQPPPPPLDSEEGVKNEAKHKLISPRSSIGSPRSSISGFA